MNLPLLRSGFENYDDDNDDDYEEKKDDDKKYLKKTRINSQQNSSKVWPFNGEWSV